MELSVLIVDDSAAIRGLLSKILTTSGLPVARIEQAGDGEEGLNQLAKGSFNLILSDINMPKMNGEEFVRHLRADARFREIPVLIITTDGSVARVHRLRELGANGYIAKPFTPDIVKNKVIAVTTPAN